MCVYDNEAPNIFGSGQEQLCNKCQGKERCEFCVAGEVPQCYFPYF